MRKIEFTTYGSSPIVGGFAPGDTARIDDEMARHFVEDVGCARFVDTVQASAPVETQETAAKPAAKRSKRTGEQA
ncbi:hypothetical protein [Aquabacterium sp. OR-4]|uniref:hypothetical protein n=1 Tax=Aquabacterium sp. OR-4 TaxID=2978127 RepID=UPI0021B40BA0|nr:hypothetical protein [Aquabacterium sp. OR-4]MDT7836464.1 hypothetical protein [Aquabacterium sp. OR-4]